MGYPSEVGSVPTGGRRPGVIITRSISDVRVGDTLITRWVKRQPIGTHMVQDFAPSAALLRWFKAEGDNYETWATYRAEYLAEMRTTYRDNPSLFEEAVGTVKVYGLAFVCYCPTAEWPPDTHCHRIPLADEVLVPLAKHRGILLRVEHR